MSLKCTLTSFQQATDAATAEAAYASAYSRYLRALLAPVDDEIADRN